MQLGQGQFLHEVWLLGSTYSLLLQFKQA